MFEDVPRRQAFPMAALLRGNRFGYILSLSDLRNGQEKCVAETLRRVIPSLSKPEIRAALDAQPDLFLCL
jgi:hypothetical protein